MSHSTRGFLKNLLVIIIVPIVIKINPAWISFMHKKGDCLSRPQNSDKRTEKGVPQEEVTALPPDPTIHPVQLGLYKCFSTLKIRAPS
jgi:hypothetical protein